MTVPQLFHLLVDPLEDCEIFTHLELIAIGERITQHMKTNLKSATKAAEVGPDPKPKKLSSCEVERSQPAVVLWLLKTPATAAKL